MSECTDYSGDGTFSVAPHIFTQAYIFQALRGKKYRAVPCAYFYLPSKEKQVYVRMLVLLKDVVEKVTGKPFVMKVCQLGLSFIE